MVALMGIWWHWVALMGTWGFLWGPWWHQVAVMGTWGYLWVSMGSWLVPGSSDGDFGEGGYLVGDSGMGLVTSGMGDRDLVGISGILVGAGWH